MLHFVLWFLPWGRESKAAVAVMIDGSQEGDLPWPIRIDSRIALCRSHLAGLL